MAHYLVTGGAGFIGSHLAQTLLERGHSVLILDNFLTGRRENIADFKNRITLVEGDIRDLGTCREAVKNADAVFHQAALPSVPRSVKDPLLTDEINIRGTLNMLVASRDAGVKTFVFASSSSVYGDDPRLPKKEEFRESPLSPYALTKLAGERYCRIFHELYGLKTVSLRYFNVFGPRQDPASQYAAVIPRFITRMLKGERPHIHGDGEQSRDFTFIENVVEANLLAVQVEDIGGAVFNTACGIRISVNRLVEKLNDILGTKIQPIHEEARPGDIKHSFAEISAIRSGLHFDPVVDFETGLRKTVQWYEKERSHG